jgi:hypothetical protein
MLSAAKQGIKQLLNAAGIEAHRFHPDTSPLTRLMAALRAFDIDLVFDIGANEGQFANALRASGYSGRMVSFEPLSYHLPIVGFYRRAIVIRPGM